MEATSNAVNVEGEEDRPRLAMRGKRRTSSVSVVLPGNVVVPKPRPNSGCFAAVDADIVDDEVGSLPGPMLRRLVLLLIVVGFASVAGYVWASTSGVSLSSAVRGVPALAPRVRL